MKDAHENRTPAHAEEPAPSGLPHWQELALGVSYTPSIIWPGAFPGSIPIRGAAGSSGEGVVGLPSPHVV